MGNRLHDLLRPDRSPRWARMLAVAVGVGLVALAFYAAIRLSMDVGYGEGER